MIAPAAVRNALMQSGGRSEDDTDEPGYGQHKSRGDGEKPKHPNLASGSIGGFIVAKRRGHWGSPVKRTDI